MNRSLNVSMGVRVPKILYEKFSKKAKLHGGSSELLREMMEAFVSDRLKITQDPEKEKLYVSGK